MQTIIRLPPAVNGCAYEPDVRRLAESRVVAPLNRGRLVVLQPTEPKNLLRLFLNTDFGAPASIELLLRAYGIPVRRHGWPSAIVDIRLRAFDALACEVADRSLVPTLTQRRQQLLRDLRASEEYYTLADLSGLQADVRSFVAAVETGDAKRVFLAEFEELVAEFNEDLDAIHLSLTLEPAKRKNGTIGEVLVLCCENREAFVGDLVLGLLQLWLEGRSLRPCESCGDYYEPKQRRRLVQRFCRIECKDRWNNDERRRRRGAAA